MKQEKVTRYCCFIGHRSINETEELKDKLYTVIEKLILDEKVGTFLFGSKSQFDRLCHTLVTQAKEKYPHIRRIYVRAEFPQIDDGYTAYLLESYEETYYSEQAVGAGKAVYVERNRDMIDQSDVCVIYCEEDYAPKNRKSGTRLALEYAVKRNKRIIRLP